MGQWRLESWPGLALTAWEGQRGLHQPPTMALPLGQMEKAELLPGISDLCLGSPEVWTMLPLLLVGQSLSPASHLC